MLFEVKAGSLNIDSLKLKSNSPSFVKKNKFMSNNKYFSLTSIQCNMKIFNKSKLSERLILYYRWTFKLIVSSIRLKVINYKINQILLHLMFFIYMDKFLLWVAICCIRDYIALCNSNHKSRNQSNFLIIRVCLE